MFCHHCGKQISDGSKFCHYCGAAQDVPLDASAPAPSPQPTPAPAPAQQTVPQYPAANRDAGRQTAGTPAKPKKMSIWMRLLFIVLAVLIGRSLGWLIGSSWNASSGDSGSSSGTTRSSGYTSSSYASSGAWGGTAYTSGDASTADTASSSAGYASDSGKIGDYYVAITTAETGVAAYTGETALIVRFDFTNYSDESTSFSLKFLTDASQDGETLSTCFLSINDTDEELYQKQNAVYQEVPSNSSIEIIQVYKLKNTTSDVLIEVKPMFWALWRPVEEADWETPTLRKIFEF